MWLILELIEVNNSLFVLRFFFVNREIKKPNKQDGKVEEHALIFCCENSKTATYCWTTINRRMLDSTKIKDTPPPRAKEKPKQDSRRGKIVFRIKPHTCQRCSESSNKMFCSSGEPTKIQPDLPLSVWVTPVEVQVISGLPQGLGLWVQQTWVWNKLSWRRSAIMPP